MDNVSKVLSLLREREEPLSGANIARKLGVSRNAIWKMIEKLREKGYQIEGGTNRGYLLLSESSALLPENIHRRLEGPARHARVEIRDVVGSTNTEMKAMAERGMPEGTTLIALRQNAGRGRLGRSFLSPRGGGLYMSVLLRPVHKAEISLAITTAAAVAAARAVEKVSGREAGIKWVNDVYVDGRKVCGILTEGALDFESGGLHYAVLGIGINLSEPAEGFPSEIADVAGAVFDGPAPAGALTEIAAEVLNRFFEYYSRLESASHMEEYRRRSLLDGLDISFVRGGEHSRGRVLGIDGSARLVVQLIDGTRTAFSAGEVAVDKDFLEQLRRK